MKELPTCGSSPSQPFPMANPPPISINGTPVRFGGRPVVIPYWGLVAGSPAASKSAWIEAGPVFESEMPLKQTACAAGDKHDDVTAFVDCGCWKVNWPSRM